ncbi:MAG: ribonuclease P Rpr2/Rpp21/SNM1 subunit [Candidatus Micrarchaeia archaeon]
MDSRRKNIIKSSVRSSVERLLDSSRKAYLSGKKERSARYVEMAFDLLKKHKIKLPADLRNSFCRKCLVIWIPGDTVTATYDRKNDCLRVRCICGHSKRL